MKPRFISFEGIDYSGKTTQIKLFSDYLAQNNIPFVVTREPGGVAFSEKVRDLLLSDNSSNLTAKTQLLLFNAARCEHIETVIKPALKNGKWVICDRFVDSSVAYQGVLMNLGLDFVYGLHDLLFGGFLPDLTFILDINTDTLLKRMRENSIFRNSNWLDVIDIRQKESLLWAYREIYKQDQVRCRLIDANGALDDVFSQIKAYIQSIMP